MAKATAARPISIEDMIAIINDHLMDLQRLAAGALAAELEAADEQQVSMTLLRPPQDEPDSPSSN